MTSSYNSSRFRSQVDQAMVSVRRILDTQRSPQFPLDVPHEYDDKYLCGEFITNAAMAAHLNCLQLFGLKDSNQLMKLKEWSQTRAVTLRFKSEEKCVFDRKVDRDVESSSSHVREYSGGSKRTDKTVTTISEYFWIFSVSYELFAYQGSSPDVKEVFASRQTKIELKTSSDKPPRPAVSVVPSMDLNFTWLLSKMENGTLGFSIDRNTKTCKTPTRNADIDAALSYMNDFHEWAGKVTRYLQSALWPVQTSFATFSKSIDQSAVNSNAFCPVFPLFEAPTKERVAIKAANSAKRRKSESLGLVKAHDNGSPILSVGDLGAFLVEEMRSLNEVFAQVDKTFPTDGLISRAEARIVVIMRHAQQICQQHADGIYYIEDMLYTQFRQAIGRSVTPADFSAYMKYHNKQLFKPEYEPTPFCYAVRRAGRTPEGYLEIMGKTDDTIPEPIRTSVRHVPNGVPIAFPINASTKVSCGGDRFLHAFVAHQFSDGGNLGLTLTVRARQFSSFIVLVGKIATAELFEPKYAALVQNKDNLSIPLTFDLVPPPKQFKAAISSISPEQQRFCNQYRSMQLGGTLFAVCVIQIKPQLEKLLNLPVDSMTKEIRLVQDLLELFIKYQIPSDLLCFDGAPHLSVDIKLNTVKHYVDNMQTLIKEAKEKELAEQKQKQEFAILSAALDDDGAEEYGGSSRGARGPRLAPSRKPASEPASAPAEEEIQDDECQEDDFDECKKDECPEPEECSKESISFMADKCEQEECEAECDDSYFNSYSCAAPICLEDECADYRMEEECIPMSEVKRSYFEPILRNIRQLPVVVENPRIKELEAEIEKEKEKLNAQKVVYEGKIGHLTKEVDCGKQRLEQLQQALKEALAPPPVEAEEAVVVVPPPTELLDFTKYPGMLDSKFEKFDEDSALRATIVNPGPVWNLTSQKGLLSNPTTQSVSVADQEDFKNKAFDLLDALTRSGCIPVADVQLHVMLASTHCFDKSIIDTIIQDNMNPIEKLERSNLIVATTVHGKSVEEMVVPEKFEGVRTYLPILFN